VKASDHVRGSAVTADRAHTHCVAAPCDRCQQSDCACHEIELVECDRCGSNEELDHSWEMDDGEILCDRCHWEVSRG